MPFGKSTVPVTSVPVTSVPVTSVVRKKNCIVDAEMLKSGLSKPNFVALAQPLSAMAQLAKQPLGNS
jgi:hypothetical protein